LPDVKVSEQQALNRITAVGKTILISTGLRQKNFRENFANSLPGFIFATPRKVLRKSAFAQARRTKDEFGSSSRHASTSSV